MCYYIFDLLACASLKTEGRIKSKVKSVKWSVENRSMKSVK